MADKASKAGAGAAQGAAAGAAVGGPWGAVIGGAIGLASGLMGSDDSAGEANNQRKIAQQILDEIKIAPDISKPLILEKYRQQGILTPEMEQQINVGVSQASKAKGSEQAKQAQMDALQSIQERSKSGLNAQDRANLNKILQETGAAGQGARGAIAQQMKERGLGGSGTDLALQLAASQNASNEASRQGDALGAMAAQNALQAAGMTGQLGGQIEGQQFGQQFQTGQAADAFRQFDVANQAGQQQRNVGSKNLAQQQNLSLEQNIANMNTQQQNQEYKDQLQRQMQEAGYNRDTAIAKAGGHSGQVQTLLQQGQQAGQGRADTAAGVGGLATNLFGALSSKSDTPAAAAPQTFGDDYFMKNAGPKWDGGSIPDYREGGQVPGQAKHPGDHPDNDTVHAVLSPGELVIPRSMAKSSLGKRLAKLLEDHHQLRKDMGGD